MENCKECLECNDCAGNSTPVMPPQTLGGACVDPNPCSSFSYTACVINEGDAVSCGTDVVFAAGATQTQINAAITSYFCARVVSTLYSALTYAQAQALIIAGTVVPGRLYKLTDIGIFLEGVSTTSFSSYGVRQMSVVKNTYYTAAGTHLGMWNSAVTPVVDDTVVYAGKVYTNLTGVLGTENITKTALDGTNWAVIVSTNTTYYENKNFFVAYDFANNWIVRQEDDRFNKFGVTYEESLDFGLIYNPVDFSDWGDNKIRRNECYGVRNNLAEVSGNRNRGDILGNVLPVTNNENVGNIRANNFTVTSNSNKGGINLNITSVGATISLNSNGGEISGNVIGGDIQSNTNAGNINDNSNSGSINFNKNIGGIISNSNAGDIFANSNNGGISSNSNGGNILQNKNNGNIVVNENTGGIFLNHNNGNIQGLGAAVTDVNNNVNNGVIITTVVGAISDVIVNK